MTLNDYREVIEDKAARFINQKREKEDLTPFQWNEELQDRARDYSTRITTNSGPELGTKRGKHYWLDEDCPLSNCAEVSAKVHWNRRDATDAARHITGIWVSNGWPTMASEFSTHGIGVWVEADQNVIYATQTLG